MYYINKPKNKDTVLVDTYTDREEAKYNHMGRIEISNKTAVLMTISFFIMAFAKAFSVEVAPVAPDITCWDGAGDTWTCGNCGSENYKWQMSCSNCGKSQ